METSEIARLRQQIDLEFESLQRGLYGFASGSARHEFIRARMDSVGNYHSKLKELIGEEEAVQILCDSYAAITEHSG